MAAPWKVILEANYRNPSFCGLVTDKINAGGAQYVPGTKWLLYQALTGYLSLTGRIPDLNAMEQVIADSRLSKSHESAGLTFQDRF